MLLLFLTMAASLGIEPRNGGFRVRCLTTWRRGIKDVLYAGTILSQEVKRCKFFRSFGHTIRSLSLTYEAAFAPETVWFSGET